MDYKTMMSIKTLNFDKTDAAPHKDTGTVKHLLKLMLMFYLTENKNKNVELLL